MGDSPEREPCQLDFREKKTFSILKFSFRQINLYDLQNVYGIT